MRPKGKKHNKKKKKTKVVTVSDDLQWVLGISNKVDTHLKVIERRLKNESIPELLDNLKKGIDEKSRKLNIGMMFNDNKTTLQQSILTSKEKYNLVVGMYNLELSNRPWYKRIFKKTKPLEKLVINGK